MAMTETEWESLPRFANGEGESESEWAERQRIPKPSSKPSFQPRTPPSYVTQVQLEAALSRVDGKIKTVSDGVSALTSRVNTLSSTTKKESEERKKDIEAQRKDISQKMQLVALLPLLVPPPTYTIKANSITAGSPASDQQLKADSGTMLNALLPLLLLGGFGGSGGSGGLGSAGSDGGMDSTMLLVLALILTQQPKS